MKLILKKKHQNIIDSNNIIHFIDRSGDPLCGMLAIDQDENEKLPENIYCKEITCKHCIETIKYYKSL